MKKSKIKLGYCNKCGDQKEEGKCPHCISKKKDPRMVALENMYASVILSFCENLAELGYRPQVDNLDCELEPDMWFRNMKPAQQRKVALKLLEIEERDAKRFCNEYNKKYARGKN